MHRLLLAVALLGLAAAVQAAGSGSAAPAAAKTSGPSWAQLSVDQKEALAPLAGEWDRYDPVRKKKWLAIAVRYKDLSPEGQQRLHERMPELAHLTPEQRKTARENFKQAYTLPAERREALTQKFQELPEDKKRELADKSRRKSGPPPRRGAAAAPSATPGPAVTPAPSAGATR